MRLSEISKKEVIDQQQGQNLGTPGSVDIIFNKDSGMVESLIIPSAPSYLFRKKAKEWEIPWEKIERIGDDFIIIDTTYLKSGPSSTP